LVRHHIPASWPSPADTHASIAYAHATRQLGTSPLAAAADDADATEARRLVGRLAPFLPDRRSALVHAGLESLVTDVAARLGPVRVPRRCVPRR
jgi:hypothetical protein